MPLPLEPPGKKADLELPCLQGLQVPKGNRDRKWLVGEAPVRGPTSVHGNWSLP